MSSSSPRRHGSDGARSFVRWTGLVAVLILAVLPLGALAAVELASFEAVVEEGRVHITWETASETDMLGFYLQRAIEQAGDYQRVSELIWATGGLSGAAYAHDDGDVAPGQTYFYRLEAVETGGHVDVHGPISVTVPLSGTATATHTPSPSRTATPTGTATPTSTGTATPTSTSAATPTNTATARPPAFSTPSPKPATATPWPTPTAAPTQRPTATATESPTRTPTSTPSATVGAGQTGGTSEPTTAGGTSPRPSLTPPGMPSATPTPGVAPGATGAATDTPVPTLTRFEAASETSRPTTVALLSSAEPTTTPSGVPSPATSDAKEVAQRWPIWLGLSLVLAVAGGGLIVWAGWGLLRRQRER